MFGFLRRSRERRQAEERLMQAVRKWQSIRTAYLQAEQRGDTREMGRLSMAVKEARTEQLAAERALS